MTNDLVGTTVFPIQNLLSKKADWFTIDYKKKSAGQVFLRVESWTPSGGSPSGKKAKDSPGKSTSMKSPGKSISLDGASAIVLTVCEAILTRNTETFGKMDPYARIVVNGQKFETGYKDGAGKNVQWMETFTIPIKSARDEL